MILTEVDRLPDAALPLDACKAHLRLGVGFSDDGGQDGLVLAYLRAAIQAIEARIGKALIARSFRLRLSQWRDPCGEVLPLAPVTAVTSVVLIGRDGGETVLEPASWRLEPDMHAPRLCPAGWMLPTVPTGGAVEVVFEAGFGAHWRDVPPDLAQAVMLLAAEYHENRHASDAPSGRGVMPFGVMALIERWRLVRTTSARRR